MFTYMAINMLFVLLILPSLNHIKKHAKSYGLTLAALFALTAIFDSLIIGVGIVDYDYSKTLGLQIGKAPVEDFFYALLAGILGPYLWHRFHTNDK